MIYSKNCNSQTLAVIVSRPLSSRHRCRFVLADVVAVTFAASSLPRGCRCRGGVASRGRVQVVARLGLCHRHFVAAATIVVVVVVASSTLPRSRGHVVDTSSQSSPLSSLIASSLPFLPRSRHHFIAVVAVASVVMLTVGTRAAEYTTRQSTLYSN
jgi:hypothetical protein